MMYADLVISITTALVLGNLINRTIANPLLNLILGGTAQGAKGKCISNYKQSSSSARLEKES